MITGNTIKTAKIYLKENFFLCGVCFLKIILINWILLNYNKMLVHVVKSMQIFSSAVAIKKYLCPTLYCILSSSMCFM